MIDGDILLDKYFIKDHLNIAKKNQIIYGRRTFLTEDLTLKYLNNEINKFSIFSKGVKNKLKALRCPKLSKMFSTIKNNYSGFQSCNFSMYLNDFKKINGFNEDFIGWGLEDTEFIKRSFNKGFNIKKVKFSIINYHLYHSENSREALDKNKQILQQTINKKITFCENGINKHLK